MQVLCWYRWSGPAYCCQGSFEVVAAVAEAESETHVRSEKWPLLALKVPAVPHACMNHEIIWATSASPPRG